MRFTATMRYLTNAKGDKVVISRSGEVIVADDNGRERERHKVPYGATLQVSDGGTIKAGKVLANWDPHHRPIITEYAGTVKFEHVEEGATVAKQIDEVTGLSTLVVIDAKRRTTAAAKGVRPSVKLLGESGEEVKIAGTDHAVNISFPVGAVIAVRDGQMVGVGEVLARIPQETSKTRDITELLTELGVHRTLQKPNGVAVAYHDSCSLQHGQRIGGETQRAAPQAARHLVEQALLVTQGWHLPRALFIADVLGLEVQGCATPAEPVAGLWRLQLREWLAQARTLGDLYVWGREPYFLGPLEPLPVTPLGREE